MNPVEKEIAESFLRDRRARSSATATMEYETVKEMYTDLRGGLSPEGRISLAGSRCGYVCDRFEFTHDAGDFHISRGGQISFRYFPFPSGAYLMGKG